MIRAEAHHDMDTGRASSLTDRPARRRGVAGGGWIQSLQAAVGNRAVAGMAEHTPMTMQRLTRNAVDARYSSGMWSELSVSSRPTTVQRRTPNGVELGKLADARERLVKVRARKEAVVDVLRKRGGFGDTLGYFQNVGWGHVTAELARLDALLQKMDELNRLAPINDRACREFISKVNFLDRSGGMNRLDNATRDLEKALLSRQRNFSNQFTTLDETYFDRYVKVPKPPLTVYRGDGRDVTEASFHTLPFAEMPAGGTPDISFAGVVEHTHTNTLKNGMVSCTTDEGVALGFATDTHVFGVVWELRLDNYIHVSDLLKARNFKYRFPGQFEVLYPGSVPAAKIVSATLYKKKEKVATRHA